MLRLFLIPAALHLIAVVDSVHAQILWLLKAGATLALLPLSLRACARVLVCVVVRCGPVVWWLVRFVDVRLTQRSLAARILPVQMLKLGAVPHYLSKLGFSGNQ